MVKESIVKMVKKDFQFLREDVLGVLLYGSLVRNEQTLRSDIDVCVVVGKKDEGCVQQNIGEQANGKYDIKIFETLPLKVKSEVLEDHVVVFANDKGELSYYLFKYRKIVNDQKLALNKLGLEMFM